MIRFEVDWPAFWLRFAAGAAVGLLMAIYGWLDAGAGWVCLVACPLVVGAIVGVAGADLWRDLWRWRP